MTPHALSTSQWTTFLSRHDLTWNKISEDWEQGAFLGNGTLGAMIYRDSPKALRWELGCCEVVERFQIPKVDWAPPRLLIGDFLLETKGEILSEEMRLDLWQAEARGTIKTNKGTIKWRSLIHAEDQAVLIETEIEGDEKATLSFRPQHGISPCLNYKRIRSLVDPEWLEVHTPDTPKRKSRNSFEFSSQDYLGGGDYAVAWTTNGRDKTQRLYVTIASSYPKRQATEKAEDQLSIAASKPIEPWIESHRSWWADYFQKSFLSFSDSFWESMYWIQIYKIGSASREGSPVIDSQGPWLTQTPWPTCVWNLNVQTSYSPLFTSNRFEIGESLYRSLDRNLPDLIMNVPDSMRHDSAGIGRASSCVTLRANTSPGWETGNLAWACFCYYRHYRCSMDDDLLQNRLYPLLRRAVNYYFHLVEEAASGRLHLIHTHSPEYGPNKYTRDSNYDLALFEWGCRTLLAIVKRLGIEDERANDWRDALERLTNPPTDRNGLRIGRDLAYEKSHRHFSHLFAIWPLRIRNVDHPQHRALADESVNHWLSLDEELQGYTWTAAASMAASYRKGDLALERLNHLRPYLQPNTMYTENGPVIETPLSAAESIHDMILQSWTDPQATGAMSSVIRVFPATPSSWRDITFHQMRAEGAFLVSASRIACQTKWIHIESLAGEPCVLLTDIRGKLASDTEKKLASLGSGRWQIPLQKGESILLYQQGEAPEPKVRPVEHTPETANYFGEITPALPIHGGQPAH